MQSGRYKLSGIKLMNVCAEARAGLTAYSAMNIKAMLVTAKFTLCQSAGGAVNGRTRMYVFDGRLMTETDILAKTKTMRDGVGSK